MDTKISKKIEIKKEKFKYNSKLKDYLDIKSTGIIPDNYYISFSKKIEYIFKRSYNEEYRRKFIINSMLPLHINYLKWCKEYGIDKAIILCIFHTAIWNKREDCKCFFADELNEYYKYNKDPHNFGIVKRYLIKMYGMKCCTLNTIIDKYFIYNKKAPINGNNKQLNILNIKEVGMYKLLSSLIDCDDNINELVKSLMDSYKDKGNDIIDKHCGLSGIRNNCSNIKQIINNEVVILNPGKCRISTNFTNMHKIYKEFIVSRLGLYKDDIERCGTTIRSILCYKGGLKNEAIKLANDDIGYYNNKVVINTDWHCNTIRKRGGYLYKYHRECYEYIAREYGLNDSSKYFFKLESDLMYSLRDKLINYCRYVFVDNDSIYYSSEIDYHLVDDLFVECCKDNGLWTDDIKLRFKNEYKGLKTA